MSTVNLYDVLNVSHNATLKEIRDSYRNLVKIYHPDRPGGDSEMFELVTQAYEVLNNDASRKTYDQIFALSKKVENSHQSLKDSSLSYYKTLEKKTAKKSPDDLKNEFKKLDGEMDRRRGYDRNFDFSTKLETKDTKSRLRDLQIAREHDDIENTHEKLFEHGMDGRFDVNRFNAAFDQMHLQHTELIPHQGNPLAWNTVNDVSNFASIESYDELFAEDDNLGTMQYGSVKLNPAKSTRLNKADINNLPSTYVPPFTNKKSNKSLDELIKERESESLNLQNRKLGDFQTGDNYGGYGIFSDISSYKPIEWDNVTDDSINDKYKRLLENRKTENI